MITSYLSPEGDLLYLSLVGNLDREGAADLVREFDERLESKTARCVLDLNGTEECDPRGLTVIDDLRERAKRERLRFSVSAGESRFASAIRGRAGAAFVDAAPGLPV